MWLHTYKGEVGLNMLSEKGGSPVYEKLGLSIDKNKWELEALNWHRSLQTLVVGFASPKLSKTFDAFYASRPKRTLPCFRLLIKTHQGTPLHANG